MSFIIYLLKRCYQHLNLDFLAFIATRDGEPDPLPAADITQVFPRLLLPVTMRAITPLPD